MEEIPKTPMNDSIEAERPKVLNIGCGKHKVPGAINLDINSKVEPECVFDLESCRQPKVTRIITERNSSLDRIEIREVVDKTQLPFADSTFDIIIASHTLEHIRNILPLMEELHRVAKPEGIIQIRVPFGGSSIAFEDPTHVRQFFPKSFEYFGQMAYNAADYGYRGDWEVVDLLLVIKDEFKGMPQDELAFMVERAFNVADEMFVVMKAIKPIRVADGVPRSLKVKLGFVSEVQAGLTEAARPVSANDSVH